MQYSLTWAFSKRRTWSISNQLFYPIRLFIGIILLAKALKRAIRLGEPRIQTTILYALLRGPKSLNLAFRALSFESILFTSAFASSYDCSSFIFITLTNKKAQTIRLIICLIHRIRQLFAFYSLICSSHICFLIIRQRVLFVSALLAIIALIFFLILQS